MDFTPFTVANNIMHCRKYIVAMALSSNEHVCISFRSLNFIGNYRVAFFGIPKNTQTLDVSI